ncbi:MAG TPA: DNA-formamidopyrimidine glycosylase family protein [Polyangia bacterium]
MPELPEVEVAARNLRRWTRDRRVRHARIDPAARRILRPTGTRGVAAALTGAAFTEVRRTGKNLLVSLAGATKRAGGTTSAAEPLGFWSHLGMTGKWVRRDAGAPRPRWWRIELGLDDGARLFYVDPRMFGRFRVVPGARFDEVPELRDLGPDPLVDGLDARALRARLGRLAVPIKVVMLDQRLFAGVGNIQANEALHRAAIDPRRPARSLSARELSRLVRAVVESIQFTLSTFAESGADGGDADIGYVEEGDVPNPFLVYGRAGEPCPRCPARRHSVIERIVQAQRATFFCRNCQR